VFREQKSLSKHDEVYCFGALLGVLDEPLRFAASDPVVTSFSLAGFAGGRRPHAPGVHSDVWAVALK
jgi:hypothetical protein